MSLKFRRQLRVEKKLLQTIARYFVSGKFKGKFFGIVSVSSVRVSGDLRLAKVFIKTLGSDREKVKNLEQIYLRLRDIQGQVNLELRMKFCPRLKFFLDEGSKENLRLESLIHKIEQNI